MKHLFITASILLLAGNATSQRVTDTIDMEPGYAKQVFYQIQTGTKHASPMTQWHIAHTTLQMDNSIRLNHAAGVFAYLYPKGDNSAYNNFDTAGWMTWTKPYNSMKDETLGALNQQKDPNNQWDFSWGGIRSYITRGKRRFPLLNRSWIWSQYPIVQVHAYQTR